MDRIFEFIIKATIYGSISGTLIWIIQIFLRKNLRPKWSYLLWTILIIKLLIPFGPESNFSIFNKFNDNYLYSIQNTKVVTEFNNSSEVYNISNSSYTNQFVNNSNTKISTTSSKTNNLFPNTDKKEMKFNISLLKKNIYNLWFIIAVNIFLFVNLTYILFNFNLNKHIFDVDVKLYNILQSSKNKLNINKTIDIVVTDYINSPSLSGIFNPKILLPLDIVSLSENELDYIFLHELSHYKRKDNLVNYILIFIQSIHWFNPLIWFFFNKIREIMELATDEIVLNILNKNEYRDYGLTLLSVFSKFKKNTFQPGLIGMAKNKKNVERRIMNIKFIKESNSKKIIFTLVGILVIGVISPIVLTSGKSNNQIVYASNENTSLSEMQNTYFKLVELKESKKELNKNEIQQITKNLNVETTNIGEDDSFIMDSYKFKNELLRVYYKKENGEHIIKNIWYYINDNTKDIYSIRLHYADNKESKNKLGIEVVTKDISIVDDISLSLDMNTKNSNLYKVYTNILNKLNSNQNLNEEDLYKINSKFIKLEDENIMKLNGNTNGEELVIKFDNSNKKINSIGLGDINFLNKQKETIWTKTVNYPKNDFLMNEYNFPKDDSASVINKFENNPEKIKEYFVKINDTYKK